MRFIITPTYEKWPPAPLTTHVAEQDQKGGKHGDAGSDGAKTKVSHSNVYSAILSDHSPHRCEVIPFARPGRFINASFDKIKIAYWQVVLYFQNMWEMIRVVSRQKQLTELRSHLIATLVDKLCSSPEQYIQEKHRVETSAKTGSPTEWNAFF